MSLPEIAISGLSDKVSFDMPHLEEPPRLTAT